jgi:hypothetical protein
MVCHKIKFIALVFAVTIGVFGFMPNQSNATGMYDMREFLVQ